MNNICQFLWNLFLNLKIFTLWNNTNFRKIRGGSDGELLVHLFLTYAAYDSHTREPLYLLTYKLMSPIMYNLSYFNQKPITKRSTPMENKAAEAFTILISTGFSLDKGDLYVPNQVLFLKPIALIPKQAATTKIKPDQNIISYSFKKNSYV